ncbi:uncharacterized protein RHOBADRAFT_51901 [Rhodotorula graminis WP1]|uniref:F-box domain-containing protein n=1 Tax=Rhodotorula graminis (strain WP1) TaxID=578459 RepID=A0A194S8M0_RHOGW|nr:uncharacterized protein RHOBADRAFT_51901 [Rhodotorula graminis WP1]KPV76919.1 hypothetical protein RHOBADRAFT_51901 [Rhodotorula graminis WP1]
MADSVRSPPRSPPVPLPPSTRLFAPSLGAKPKPATDSASAPSSTSPRASGKRTPTSRMSFRRLSFSTVGASGSSTSAASPGSSTPYSSSTPASTTSDAGGFTFVPYEDPVAASSSSSALGRIVADAFDMRDMASQLSAIADTASSPSSSRPMIKLRTPFVHKKARIPRPRTKSGSSTTIEDLPDELLLRIFGFLNDWQGFRPVPGKDLDETPTWYTPPLRVGLVCRRWLPVARALYYRFLKISHVERVSALHAAFLANPNLPAAVRHLSIDLPYGAGAKLSLCATPEPGATAEGTVPEADHSPVKKRKPLTRGDELRAVFQSCAHLLSLEMSGVAPALLLGSSSSRSTTSALHHLHQLRLSTVTRLTLRGGTGAVERGGDGVPVLDAASVRDALLALTGLRSLTLKGFASSLSPDGALDFAPTRTHLGLTARPLPLRARTSARLPLERLALVECCISAADLRALVEQCQRGKLRSLAVVDLWDADSAKKNRREGRQHLPSVESLHDVTDLVAGSVEHLRATLYNYPPATDVAEAAASTALRSPERSTSRRLPPVGSARAGAGRPLDAATSVERARRPVPPAGERHILDGFIAQLEGLKTLDIGGSVVSPALFAPHAHPYSHTYPLSSLGLELGVDPTGATSRSHRDPPGLELHLAPTLRTLTLRSCDLLPPSALVPWLRSLALPFPASSTSSSLHRSHPSTSAPPSAPSRLSHGPAPPALRTLRTLGGSEHGWARPTACLEVQRACWAAGIVWTSGGGSGPDAGVDAAAGGTAGAAEEAATSWRPAVAGALGGAGRSTMAAPASLSGPPGFPQQARTTTTTQGVPAQEYWACQSSSRLLPRSGGGW